MPIIKRGQIYWLNVTVRGERHRESLRTSNLREARRRAQILESQFWESNFLEKAAHPSAPTVDCPNPSRPTESAQGDERNRARFETEEEFRTAFGLFRELSPTTPWKATTAAKDHEDDFGEKIARGELYYSRAYPPAFHNMERLSRKSMEAVLCVLFRNNLETRSLAEELRKSRLDRERTYLEKASQGWNLPDRATASGDNTPP